MTRTVATIMCGACAAEHRREPRVLGAVIRTADGLVLWEMSSSRWARAVRKLGGSDPGSRDVRTLAHPGISDLSLPDRLRVFCRAHGNGTVSTRDVLGARGSMTINFQATV